jgi:acyl CoA:acetate/3-ketoacid CoA transferase
VKKGDAKFVREVDEVTFNAAAALKAGKRIFYATTIGIFALTDRGLTLVEVMPGITAEDITATSAAAVHIPPWDDIPLVQNDIVTGRGFVLGWKRSMQ